MTKHSPLAMFLLFPLLFLAAEASAAPPAPTRIEIDDVDRSLEPGGRIKEDVPVCLLEARNDADRERLARIWSVAGPVFEKDWTNVGPDAPFRRIRIDIPGRQITLVSWHPPIERDPRLVALSHGVVNLEGRDRDALLAEDDPAYLARRRAFDNIVAACKEAHPAP